MKRINYRVTILFCTLISFMILVISCKTSNEEKVSEDNFTVINNLTDLRLYAAKDNVNIRLESGNYQIDSAESIRFLQFTGNNSHFNLEDVRFMVDTKLFSRTDLKKSTDGNAMYCAIEISGNNVIMEGLYIETYGDKAGIQSKNKIFNIIGEDVTLKNVEIRTAGSSPWGYGSLYGIYGKVVRKMNGIRVGYPAKNVKLIGCKVHARAMGHSIFIQGAENTLIEDCHVDGLLRTTDAILAETSGYAFERDFFAGKKGYIEGTNVGKEGKILPGEMVSLSEDGIRMYPDYKGHPTKNTTIKNCTVSQMRRGICTGLSTSGDKVINSQVRRCVAAGFNVGNKDTLINCSADAKYSEALSLPYKNAQNASVELNILDSRNGKSNNVLAVINGTGNNIVLKTANASFVPESLVIELSSNNGYAVYQGSKIGASNIQLDNKTQATVVLLPGTINPKIISESKVIDKTK
jgi:hypothetical protein